MTQRNLIGLETEKAEKLIEKLNELLANYQLFYMNIRGFHWNIKGEKFFELHVKFEELYNDLFIKIDDIAERIVTLGGIPLHTYTDFLAVSDIKEVKNASGPYETVNSILESFKALLLKQRELLEISDKADDEGTNALMSDYISEQEKLVWMYSAFLNK